MLCPAPQVRREHREVIAASGGQRAGRLHGVASPYLRLLLPGLATVAGFVGLVELASFLTIGQAQGKSLVLFGRPIHPNTVMPWVVAAACLVLGGLWLSREAASFRRVWDDLNAGLERADVS